MRRLIVIPLLLFSMWLSAAVYYVAPAGSDAAAGTIGAPWRTWGYAFSHASPDDTVYFRGGTYIMDVTTGYGYRTLNDGTAGHLIYFLNYPDEVPVLDCNAVIPSVGSGTLNNVIRGTWNYVYIKGLQIKNVWQNDPLDECYAWDLDAIGTTIENCKTYNVHGVAWNINSGTDLHFINCDAWNCCDSLTAALPGNDGAGFRVFAQTQPTGSVYFKDCRAWLCGDQGFSSGAAGYTEYDGCWSFNNGLLEGEGHGFKMGWISVVDPSVSLHRLYKNCIAVYNRANGWTTNDAGYYCGIMNLYNNIAYHNGYPGGYAGASYGFLIYNTLDTDTRERLRIYRNNIAYYNEDGATYVSGGALYTHDHNSWDASVTVTNADFISVDSTGLAGARQSDGSLPALNFLKLASTSDLIDAGVDVGLDYSGNAPDISAYEYEEAAPPSTPLISTLTPYAIRIDRATTGGYMISDGGGTITAKGICWGENALPNLTDNVISGGTGTADFTITIAGLAGNTTYHVRAYATNESGTVYGSDEEFTTSQSSIIKHGGKIVKR